jgi:hypothetical protein
MKNASTSKGWRNPTVIAAIIGGIAAIVVAIIGVLSKPRPQEAIHIAQQTPSNTPQIEATGGVAVGRDLRDTSIIFGFTDEEVQKLIQSSTQELKTTYQAQVDELSQRLAVRQDVVITSLSTLRRERVPPEELAETLAAIAQRHQEMMERLASLHPKDPLINVLIDRAQTAIKQGDYNRANSIIDTAEELHPMSPQVLPQDDTLPTSLRQPIETYEHVGSLPVTIQGDGSIEQNPIRSLKAPFDVSLYFMPSGLMGDFEDKHIRMHKAFREGTRQGDTDAFSIRVHYQPSSVGWAGIYWQYPDGNWGDQPGIHIERATRVVFWARGDKGGEVVEFRAGGILNPERPYRDSFERSIGFITLTDRWQRYEINLSAEDTSHVIGAFAWIATRDHNPEGLTFYLDDIHYE